MSGEWLVSFTLLIFGGEKKKGHFSLDGWC